VVDSPNSAGIVIDAVRIAKLALDRGLAGPLEGPSAYLMKAPPVQHSDSVARQMCEDFISGRPRRARRTAAGAPPAARAEMTDGAGSQRPARAARR
jgi:hypothetical protein